MRKYLFIAAGFIFLLIGVIGAFLPVLPTTPFVLLAGLCFAKSSPALYERLKRMPKIGEFIRHYSDKTHVSTKTRVQTIIFLWAGLLISMWFIKNTIINVILALIGIAVTIHLVTIKAAQVERIDERIEELEESRDGSTELVSGEEF
ncbi:MAG: YbaN family protein [Actinomycetia bacterium]|nr:YbaN family protein [Actinomycetes bacterium]